jgi:NAD-dependent dihydropyrimidine dehydrogenase PreA subunit
MAWIEIDEEKCDGCGECVEICPAAVFEISKKKAVPRNMDECVECCACVDICPQSAIGHDAC